MAKYLFLFLGLLSFGVITPPNSSLPQGFVYLTDVVPNIIVDLRYLGEDNFVGKPVNGYKKEVVIITKPAALALKSIADTLEEMRLKIKVFDAYRPQPAVDHFVEWAMDLSDTLTKHKYYPEVNKADLFRLNYIASRSGHSRGSTIDLTLVNENNVELDMGTSWDYFGSKSWPSDTTVSKQAQINRKLLRDIMTSHGFEPYQEEWWHFTLKNEPYKEIYFDFEVK
ncbi:MAG: M15 family metallopeptidase [Salibacteraceae bacterium]